MVDHKNLNQLLEIKKEFINWLNSNTHNELEKS